MGKFVPRESKSANMGTRRAYNPQIVRSRIFINSSKNAQNNSHRPNETKSVVSDKTAKINHGCLTNGAQDKPNIEPPHNIFNVAEPYRSVGSRVPWGHKGPYDEYVNRQPKGASFYEKQRMAEEEHLIMRTQKILENALRTIEDSVKLESDKNGNMCKVKISNNCPSL